MGQLMRACLFEGEQQKIGKKHVALNNLVLPAATKHFDRPEQIKLGVGGGGVGNIITYD